MKTFLFIIIFVFSLSAEDELFKNRIDPKKAPEDFQEISKALSNTAALTADFTQLKKIKALRRPLKSSGKLTLSSKLGVHWNLKKPYESIIVINSEKMSSIDDKGKKITFTAEEKPVLYNFTRIFMSIFTGKTEELQEHFDLYFDGGKDKWRIGLTPKSSQLQKVITRITLSGSEINVNSLTILEHNGDKTDINFKDIKTPGSLSEEDKKKFDF